MSAAATAAALADDARESASGTAVAVVDADDEAIHLDPGADVLTPSTRFDIGSVAKTFTALVLAEMTVAGDVDLEAPAAREMTFLQLATHTSGLPRLPGNLMAKARQSPDDPYRNYTPDDLADAIAAVEVTPGPVEYSNFGYMALGAALADTAGLSYGELLTARVLTPLGLADTGLGWEDAAERVPGYVGNRPVPDWTLQVPGPGGITSTVSDMARYLRAHLDPTATQLAGALELVQKHPLGWQAQGAVRWHNGGSGGFGAMVAFDRAASRAVAILTNREHSPTIDALALRALRPD